MDPKVLTDSVGTISDRASVFEGDTTVLSRLPLLEDSRAFGEVGGHVPRIEGPHEHGRRRTADE
jgi:hypothetical protein